jgi:hypothetical protein
MLRARTIPACAAKSIGCWPKLGARAPRAVSRPSRARFCTFRRRQRALGPQRQSSATRAGALQQPRSALPASHQDAVRLLRQTEHVHATAVLRRRARVLRGRDPHAGADERLSRQRLRLVPGGDGTARVPSPRSRSSAPRGTWFSSRAARPGVRAFTPSRCAERLPSRRRAHGRFDRGAGFRDRGGQHLAARRGHEHVVFDADAAHVVERR